MISVMGFNCGIFKVEFPSLDSQLGILSLDFCAQCPLSKKTRDLGKEG